MAYQLNPLIISSCMAPNMDFLCRDLAAYLSGRLGSPVDPLLDVPWQERERRLDSGQVGLCWICGLPYVRKADAPEPAVEPLVAPVMAGSRYGGKPVYYSDVVVRRESPYQAFTHLGGAAWAYNEPGSHSGYGVVRYALALRGETLEYFGRVVESGAHQVSLELILRGEVDASAIDSTVLELEMARRPELAAQIRVIDTLGPSPIPPWVVGRQVPDNVRADLHSLLVGMDTDPEGRLILDKARLLRFVPVTDRDYDPIRAMARLAFPH